MWILRKAREKLKWWGLNQADGGCCGLDWQVHLTLDRRAALKDADFVTTQFRVGLLMLG